MEIGQNIKLLRLEKQMSQKKLASKAGITHNYLSMIENNNKTPSLNLIEKLAKILEAPISAIFSELKITFEPTNLAN